MSHRLAIFGYLTFLISKLKTTSVSPLTKSTSIRSGLTCPVFFGLFLKPCRGRQRGGVSVTTSTHSRYHLRKLGYRTTSCKFLPSQHTHTYFGGGTPCIRPHMDVQLCRLILSSFSAVSSSAELRKTFPSVHSFPVVVSLTLVFTFQYICTMCSTNITSVLLTLAHKHGLCADKQTDQLSH